MFVMRKKGEIFYVAMQEFNFQNFLFENLFLRTSYTSSISKVHFSEAAERESFLLTLVKLLPCGKQFTLLYGSKSVRQLVQLRIINQRIFAKELKNIWVHFLSVAELNEDVSLFWG